MSEYIGGQPLVIDEGEDVPIPVGTRLIFYEGGKYLISAYDGKISVPPLDGQKDEVVTRDI